MHDFDKSKSGIIFTGGLVMLGIIFIIGIEPIVEMFFKLVACNWG